MIQSYNKDNDIGQVFETCVGYFACPSFIHICHLELLKFGNFSGNVQQARHSDTPAAQRLTDIGVTITEAQQPAFPSTFNVRNSLSNMQTIKVASSFCLLHLHVSSNILFQNVGVFGAFLSSLNMTLFNFKHAFHTMSRSTIYSFIKRI